MYRRHPGNPFLIEPEGDLIEIDTIGVTVFQLPGLGIPADLAVVVHEAVMRSQLVVDQGLPDENSRRVIGIDFLVVDRPAVDHQAVEVQRFGDGHPLGGSVPPLVRIRGPAQMAAQFRGPSGLYSRHGARIEPVGFDHFRGDDPRRRSCSVPLSVLPILPGIIVNLSSRTLSLGFRVRLPSKENGTGEDHGRSVPGPCVEVAFPLLGDLAEQSAQDRTVDCVVVRATGSSRPAAETAGFPERATKLHVDVAPFPHSVVGQIVLPAEPAHCSLGLQVLEGIVKGIPDI